MHHLTPMVLWLQSLRRMISCRRKLIKARRKPVRTFRLLPEHLSQIKPPVQLGPQLWVATHNDGPPWLFESEDAARTFSETGIRPATSDPRPSSEPLMGD
jgi:hypothetical protein